MLKRFVLIATVAMIAAVALACGDDDESEGGNPSPADADEGRSVEVTAQDFEFSPQTISAAGGETLTLTLTNDGSSEHSFTIDAAVDVEAEGGEEASDSFTVPDGGADFYCRYHPEQMTGSITLESSAESDSDSGGAAGY
jgi:plastocyanin